MILPTLADWLQAAALLNVPDALALAMWEDRRIYAEDECEKMTSRK